MYANVFSVHSIIPVVWRCKLLSVSIWCTSMKTTQISTWKTFPVTCSYFGDITLCSNGQYSFTIWVKVPMSALAHHVTGSYILSSGGHTGRVTTGGMALLIQLGMMWIVFRSRPLGKKWEINDMGQRR